MASFQDLTAELVDLVVSHLDAPGLCAFRLTSRESHERSYREFASRIADLRWLVAPHSLKTLHAISKDERLSGYIKILRVGMHYLENDGAAMDFADDLEAAEGDDDACLAITKRQQRFTEYLDAQNAFRHGDDMGMFTSIMSNLHAVDRIEVGELYCGTSDQYSPCYGMRTLKAETGMQYFPLCVPDTTLQDDEDGLAHDLNIVLRTLSLLRKPISELSVFRFHPNGSLGDLAGLEVAKMRAFKGYYADGLQVAFRDLRSLKMLLSYWQGELSSGQHSWNQWLPDFLALTPRLQHLSLTFDGTELKDPSDKPYRLLAFAAFAQKSSMTHLTSLELSNCAVNPQDLRCLFDRHTQSLTNITLNRILLASGSWREDIFGALQTRVDTFREYKVAWLMERKPLGLTDVDHVVVFSKQGFDKCKQCQKDVDDMAMTADEHVSKTLTAAKAGGVVEFNYDSIEALQS